MATSEEDIHAFLEWMKSRGVNFDNIELKANPEIGGHGVYLKKDCVRDGQVILQGHFPPHFLSLSALLTSSTLIEDPNCGPIIKGAKETYGFSFTPSEALGLLLIFEDRAEDSRYAPYLKILPRTFDTPFFRGVKFEQSDVPGEVWTEWNRRIADREEFSRKIKTVFPSPPPTSAEIEWAWHIVNTRSLYVQDLQPLEWFASAGADEVALAPLIDMLNHSDPNCMTHYRKTTNTYELVCVKDTIAQDQELLITYGEHEDWKLWMDYGFTLEGNLLNKVPMSKLLFLNLIEKCGVSIHQSNREIIMEESPCESTLYASEVGLSMGMKYNLRIILEKFPAYYLNGKKWRRQLARDASPELEAMVQALGLRVVAHLRNFIQAKHEKSQKRFASSGRTAWTSSTRSRIFPRSRT
ncbi:hypothetical protein L596_010731 [Steinernema carpocapsae]|uniref:SET domain-containing protein n=1 Tax=Steinernema carpocapsae TaxID=34508 RepID=A0A4U5PJU0_STECR|nr:hypothetical protein L596_010731 [Steinernema carpocapsae]